MIIVGHRGGGAPAPENTLRSIRDGIRCADFVEVDVRFSRDLVPVVIHDATLERTTDGRGRVADCDLEELKRFDAGEGERIPALAEVLMEVKGRCGLVLELKEAGNAGLVCDLLSSHRVWPLLIVSFHREALEQVHACMPALPIGFIYSRREMNPLHASGTLPLQAILPRFDLLDEKTVREAHGRGLQVIAWTLNEPAQIGRVSAMGADGFATDFACRAREVLKSLDAH